MKKTDNTPLDHNATCLHRMSEGEASGLGFQDPSDISKKNQATWGVSAMTKRETNQNGVNDQLPRPTFHYHHYLKGVIHPIIFIPTIESS